MGLLATNKQVREEASRIFYIINTFIFGNGPWRSRKFANLHGLKLFKARIPQRFRDLISKIMFTVWTRHGYVASRNGEQVLEMMFDPYYKSQINLRNDDKNLLRYSHMLATMCPDVREVEFLCVISADVWKRTG